LGEPSLESVDVMEVRETRELYILLLIYSQVKMQWLNTYYLLVFFFLRKDEKYFATISIIWKKEKKTSDSPVFFNKNLTRKTIQLNQKYRLWSYSRSTQYVV